MQESCSGAEAFKKILVILKRLSYNKKDKILDQHGEEAFL